MFESHTRPHAPQFCGSESTGKHAPWHATVEPSQTGSDGGGFATTTGGGSVSPEPELDDEDEDEEEDDEDDVPGSPDDEEDEDVEEPTPPLVEPLGLPPVPALEEEPTGAGVVDATVALEAGVPELLLPIVVAGLERHWSPASV